MRDPCSINQMVSQHGRTATGSKERLLAAAAAEFAARGFDGAKVDRIAARARLNKAMLYYHFKNKARLYREILMGIFQSLGDAADTLPREGTADERLRRFVRTIAAETSNQPNFPSIWLREMAEGGRHLDPAILGQMKRVLGALAGILQDGRRAGVFREAHPMITQMSIVAPLLLFAASAPLRARFGAGMAFDPSAIQRDDVVAHIEIGTLAALRPIPIVKPAPVGRRRKR